MMRGGAYGIEELSPEVLPKGYVSITWGPCREAHLGEKKAKVDNQALRVTLQSFRTL